MKKVIRFFLIASFCFSFVPAFGDVEDDVDTTGRVYKGENVGIKHKVKKGKGKNKHLKNDIADDSVIYGRAADDTDDNED